MQGERAVSVGLSLTLHACLVGIVIARVAVAPGLTPRVPITVSFDAPPSIGESAAALPQEIPPSVVSDARPAVVPTSVAPVPSTPALSGALAASSFGDKGAGPELRPMAAAPPSQAPDGSAPDLPAVRPSAGQVIASTSSGVDAKPLPVEAQAGLSAMAADLSPANPLASKADTLGTIPAPQATSEEQFAAPLQETAPPAVSSTSSVRSQSRETIGGTAVGPEIPAIVLPLQRLAEASSPSPSPPTSPAEPATEVTLTDPAPMHASALPVTGDPKPQSAPEAVRAESLLTANDDAAPPSAVIALAAPTTSKVTPAGPEPLHVSALPFTANPEPQPVPEVKKAESLPVRQVAEAPAPVVSTGTPSEALIASLAPAQPGTAVDLGTMDIPVQSTDAARAQQIRAFVDQYDGGPCFFAAVRRVSASGADIESFSTTPGTFQQFDRALKTSTGIEPTVSGQRIWSPQCPAIEYLRKLPHDTDATPTLDLERRDLGIGDALSGTVQGAGGRPLRLFVISETGVVTDVSDGVSERNGTPAFSFQPRSAGSGGPFPQILVLVAGSSTLPLHPVSVDDLFRPLTAAKGTGYSVTAKMFLVTR